MELHHHRSGSGDDLVLIHGITESSASFDPIVGHLAERFRVTAIDLRGHGQSPRTGPFDAFTMTQDVVDTLGAIGVERPLLVGHSLGGNVVSLFPLLAPALAVINVDQPLALGAFQDTLQQLEPLLRGDDSAFHTAVDLIFHAMRGRLNDTEWSRIQASRRYDQEVVLGVWELVLTTPADELDALVTSSAQAVSVPYLSLHGTDPGDDYARWLTSLMPSATVEVWAGDGHYPHLVEPERFVARVGAFSDSLS